MTLIVKEFSMFVLRCSQSKYFYFLDNCPVELSAQSCYIFHHDQSRHFCRKVLLTFTVLFTVVSFDIIVCRSATQQSTSISISACLHAIEIHIIWHASEDLGQRSVIYCKLMISQLMTLIFKESSICFGTSILNQSKYLYLLKDNCPMELSAQSCYIFHHDQSRHFCRKVLLTCTVYCSLF